MQKFLLFIALSCFSLPFAAAENMNNHTAVVVTDSCDMATSIQDLFGGAANVPQTSMIFDNTGFTVSDTDPDTGFECFAEPDGSGSTPSLENTYWFTFTGDGETYLITSNDCGGTAMNYIQGGDTQFALYSGTSCMDLTPVACNDDYAGAPAADPFRAGFFIDTEDGVTYYLLVDGFNGADGEFCLEVTQSMPVTCDSIAVGTFSTVLPDVCFGDTTEFDITDGTLIPQEGGFEGYLVAVSTTDISGSTDPFNAMGFIGSFGTTPTVYLPSFINDGTQIPAGTYFFTPIVASGGVDTDGTLAGLDFSNGCILVGNSVEVNLLAAQDDLSAEVDTNPETNPMADDGEATVTVSGGSGSYTYMWDTGDTTQTISGLDAGAYSVTVSDVSGCVADLVVVAQVDGMVDAGEPEFLAAVQVFPNPAREQLTIDYNFDQNLDLSLRITNAVGQQMWSRQIAQSSNQTLQVNLANFAAGVYFLHMSDGSRQLTRLVVVSR